MLISLISSSDTDKSSSYGIHQASMAAATGCVPLSCHVQYALSSVGKDLCSHRPTRSIAAFLPAANGSTQLAGCSSLRLTSSGLFTSAPIGKAARKFFPLQPVQTLKHLEVCFSLLKGAGNVGVDGGQSIQKGGVPTRFVGQQYLVVCDGKVCDHSGRRLYQRRF